MSRFAVAAVTLAVAGCGHSGQPIVRHEVVRVPVEVVRPINEVLLREIEAMRLAPACTLEGRPAYCNGQMARLLDDALRVIDQHNADKRAIRHENRAERGDP